MKMKRIFFILTVLFIFIDFSKVQAKTDDDIIYFNDKNLETALCRKYNCKAPITKKMAHDLSTEDEYISYFSDKKISDLEGLQYFDGLISVSFYGSNLTNLEPLSKLPNLTSLHISSNSIKGEELENCFKRMGKIKKLKSFGCYNNDIEDISFLEKIGNISEYEELELSYNKIKDISMLKKCKNIHQLNLEHNRITDVKPLKNLDCDFFYIHDNCIINLKPIKPMLDALFNGKCGLDNSDRLDFYQNPVNFIFENKEIQFPHMTVYYKFQAYAEAVPLIKALGGIAEYNKDTGTLTCKIDDKEIIMKDFSNTYIINGMDKMMTYEMRRMQYDVAYIPVKDFCKILGLSYNSLKERTLFVEDSEILNYAPEIVEISNYEVSDRTNDYKFKIIDNQVGIIKHLGTETSVIIPSQINGFPVTCIEDGAFTDDINLVSVTIPDTITRIGTSWGEEGVFSGCNKLINVNINEGKENAYIGSNAFLDCSQLKSINIPGNYKVIYDNAFKNCTSLQSITISEGVERIGVGAFARNGALTSISIPSTMKAIGYEYNEFSAIDPEYADKTGAFAYCKMLSKVDIAEGKEDAYIGANTFYKCSRLKSIIIPGNYKAVYENAFTECVRLRSFVYEKSNLKDCAYQMIDNNVFEGCIRLNEVSLSNSLKTIGDSTFSCCNIKEIIIPEGVTEIGKFSFSGNTALQSVSLPSTIISIGRSLDDSYEGGTFYNCINLSRVLMKEGKQNAWIGAITFEGCKKLEKIIIPGNYITIGEEAFSGCTSLKSVIYKNNSNPYTKQKILTYAFKGCKNLVAIALPPTLTLLEFESFGECTKLKTVTIPTGVNKLYLKGFVFDSCPSLTSVYVGENVQISRNAFSLSCSKAKIFTHNKSVKEAVEYGDLKAYSSASDYVNGKTLFGSLEIIGTMEFGSILTANIDAVAPIDASVSYEWNIDGKTVSTKSTYVVKKDVKGKIIKLTITGINGYAGSLTQTVKY